MRKYQQLLLLLVSCCSVAVLLMYKSENNRLKYVLKVVNFFGRSDVANTVSLGQGQFAPKKYDTLLPDFVQPLPVWQAIDYGNFYAYATYWNHNELIAGGEVIALVTGKRGAVINFRCALLYDYGTRSVQGKFRFQRLDEEFEDAESYFTSYSFSCRLTRDFGQPESVAFSAVSANLSAATQHNLQLRYVRDAAAMSNAQQSKLTTTVCLNLVGIGGNQSDAVGGGTFVRDERHMLQFFLHHHYAMGVVHFLVYNSDALPRRLPSLLLQQAPGVQLHRLPFNFPFALGNITSASRRLRRFVETDCLMRNVNAARHTVLLSANEFFYANSPTLKEHLYVDRFKRSLDAVLKQYPSAISRFEFTTFAVCLDAAKPLLVDNTLYDPEARSPHRNFVYVPHVPLSTATVVHDETATTKLSLSQMLAHRYVECLRPGKDGLHDWRGKLRDDFLRRMDERRNEVATFLQPSAVAV